MIGKLKWALAALTVVGLAACAKEAGRVPFTGEGEAESTLSLQSGEVDFWTDIAIEFEGDAALAYQVELVQAGSVVAKAACNPLGHMSVKMGWVETNLGSSHSRRGNGKMDCAIELDRGGVTTVKARLAFAARPPGLKLSRADLVVKQ